MLVGAGRAREGDFGGERIAVAVGGKGAGDTGDAGGDGTHRPAGERALDVEPAGYRAGDRQKGFERGFGRDADVVADAVEHLDAGRDRF